jgi:drug/metabolite transporter (DMT)-like permease
MESPSRAWIIAGLLVVYLVWGSTYLAIRVAVETMPPFLMAGVRFLVAGVIMTMALMAMKKFKATPSQWAFNILIGLFLLLGGNGLVSWAEQTVPSGIATLVVSFNPLMIVGAEWLIFGYSKGRLGAKPNAMVFAGMGVGLVGLGLLVSPSLYAEAGGGHDPWRIGAIILACLAWTIGSMMVRYSKNPVDPFSGSAIQMLGGGVWLLLFGGLIGEFGQADWSAFSYRSIIAWWYLVIAGSLLTFTTYVWLTKHASPTLVSTYAYVNPVVAVFLGWLMLNEVIDRNTYVAAAIIIAGVALITVGKSKKPAADSNETTASEKIKSSESTKSSTDGSVAAAVQSDS